MSKKYQITGPNGEIIGVFYQPKEDKLMIGGLKKYKPFIDHICFNVLKITPRCITKDEVRQSHKFRYYFDIDTDFIDTQWYVLSEKYKVEEIDSIIKIT